MTRYTASTITDDALEQLYENASRGWRRGDEWKERALSAEKRAEKAERAADLLADAHRRAEQAEAAAARLLAWCDRLDEGTRELTHDPFAQHPVAANVRHQLAEPEER